MNQAGAKETKMFMFIHNESGTPLNATCPKTGGTMPLVVQAESGAEAWDIALAKFQSQDWAYVVKRDHTVRECIVQS